MTVFSCPLGALQPHQSGVRFGKCQASRNVKSPAPPDGMVRDWQRTPTLLRSDGSSFICPVFEKASQNSSGEFHHEPFGHPRQYVRRTSAVAIALRTKLP